MAVVRPALFPAVSPGCRGCSLFCLLSPREGARGRPFLWAVSLLGAVLRGLQLAVHVSPLCPSAWRGLLPEQQRRLACLGGPSLEDGALPHQHWGFAARGMGILSGGSGVDSRPSEWWLTHEGRAVVDAQGSASPFSVFAQVGKAARSPGCASRTLEVGVAGPAGFCGPPAWPWCAHSGCAEPSPEPVWTVRGARAAPGSGLGREALGSPPVCPGSGESNVFMWKVFGSHWLPAG